MKREIPNETIPKSVETSKAVDEVVSHKYNQVMTILNTSLSIPQSKVQWF